ncbi:ATP-binding protein [Rhizobium sp. CAU 1783]
MPASYPFIDVAVHENVRARFARGEALVLFSPALDQVLWANGAGARFFGNASIYDLLEEGPNRGDVTFRQIETVARQLAAVGDSRSLVLRIASGFQRVPVNANAEMVEIRKGERAVLLSVPATGKAGTIGERAADMLTGFDDPDTHMAVLDGDGAVVAASARFAALGVTPQTARTLVHLVSADADHLLKRPIPTGRGHLPAAIGKLSDDPALHLLFAVETILGNMDPTDSFEADAVAIETQPAAPTDEREPQPTVAPEAVPVIAVGVASAEAGFADIVDALGNIEEIEGEELETVTEAEDSFENDDASLETAAATVAEQFAEAEETVVDEPGQADMFAGQVEGTEVPAIAAEEPLTVGDVITKPGDETAIEDKPLDDVADADVETAAPPAPPSVAALSVSAAPNGRFVFAPDRRATRFVWKIDADGRFCDVSSEFAEAVGPRAAAINGVAFRDLAALFNLDPDGKIGELLKKRDTWSGKTIYWPVEGTTLMVPVDLAALPTYTRSRDFDGFRGFGIVRIADAIEDPNHTGLTFVDEREDRPAASGAPAETVIQTLSDMPAEAAVEMRAEAPAPAIDMETPAAAVTETHATDTAVEPAGSDQTMEEPEPADESRIEVAASDEVAPVAETGPEAPAISPPVGDAEIFELKAADEVGPREPAGEPPALQLVETPGRRHSDKVVQLEERRARGREGLTPGEEAAFREIARKLDPLGLREKAAEALAEMRKHDKASETEKAPAADEETAMPLGGDIFSAVDTDDTTEEPQITPATAETFIAPQPADSAPSDDAVVEDFQALRLKRENSLNGDIVDLMPVALLVHAGDRLIHANPEFLSLTGYASIEALAEAGGLDVLIQRQDLEGAGEEAGQVVIVRADDELVPVTARLQSVKFDRATALMLALVPSRVEVRKVTEAAPSATVTSITDVQAPAAAEQLARLQVEADELRSILETATDGVVILGADGDIRSMNRAASALFNFDEAETRGKPFVMLFAHESQKSIMDYLGGLSGHGVASVLNDGREVIGREASGGFLPLFMTIGKLSSSNGYCAVIRDITQWKRTEEELRNAKRAAETANAHKSDFLARVSHEIRTPLNAIIGFADMMANEHFGPVGHPRYAEYANDIVRSGRHVLDIVNDLLDISKIEAGEMDLDFTAVGLNETVQAAVSIVQPQANGQRVIIRTALSQSVPNVVADLRSIKQIVLNILANAIRFTPSGGQIIVSTAYEPNGSVALRIRDTGIGMSRTELEQAMKPFRQVQSGMHKRGDGTGLGLPLTKAMVDANRANFSISSAPNEGTLVEIIFPSQRVLAD